MNVKTALYGVFLVVALLGFSGCDLFLSKIEQTEVGVRFRKLPPALGGGVAGNVLQPGGVIVYPWDSIYRFKTNVQSVEWGPKGVGDNAQTDDHVRTRALDGNEVALAVQVQYFLKRDPESVLRIIQHVGLDDEAIRDIVIAAARADIRTHMNKLKTAEFLVTESKIQGEAAVKDGMQKRLDKYGIVIERVTLREHRFERILPSGEIDRSYQDRINRVQTLDENTKRERLRIKTVVAEKEREMNQAVEFVNQLTEKANGYFEQTKSRADSYLEVKKNEALAIKAAGDAEVEGLTEQINALAGPGGKALLKLELVKQLTAESPNFVVLGSRSSGLDVSKVDMNDLLQQIGVIEAMQENASRKRDVPAESTEDSKEDDQE